VDAGSASYDEVADAYRRTFDADGSALRDPVFESLLSDVNGRHVLALACGQGRDARLLVDLGATVVGVDISERMLGYARRTEETTPRGIRYVRGDAQDLEAFDGETFDGVVCHMALMDVPELEPTVASVARVLRPDGWFVFSIVHPRYRPHVDNLSGYLGESRYEKSAPQDALPGHAYHRPISTYVNALAAAGLSIVQMVEAPAEPAAGGDIPQLVYVRCSRVGAHSVTVSDTVTEV
jgi:ubiquinone/menaquinone biosynthesis C-methylase UbiE